MICLDKIEAALKTAIAPDRVYHHHAHKQATPYIVWAEDGTARGLHGDNRPVGQVLTGTVDYYTLDESDPAVDAIQSALTAASIPWRLNSVQYEEDTEIIHYEWVWEAINWLA